MIVTACRIAYNTTGLGVKRYVALRADLFDSTDGCGSGGCCQKCGLGAGFPLNGCRAFRGGKYHTSG